MRRVRGRRRSSSADSDGTPEKMMTGTSAGVDTTTSRPAIPRFKAQIDDRRDHLVLRESLEPFLGGLGRHNRKAVHLEEFDQGAANREIVLDDEHEAGGILRHNIGCLLSCSERRLGRLSIT